MAKVQGGVTGRPAGKVAGLIFGAARTREGKAVTVREAVNPSNPQTAEQQAQRGRFQQSLDVVKQIGPAIYQEDWNRAVGQLPGFQSWMSILLNNIDGSDVLQPPPDVALGSLHFPAFWEATTGAAAGEVDVAWNTQNGANGTDADQLVVVAIQAEADAEGKRSVIASPTTGQRVDGSITMPAFEAGESYVLGIYFRGAGAADGLVSLAGFATVTAGA